MTPEELMKPRYKIIADYPGNVQDIGCVFRSDLPSYFNKFPAISQPLPWYAERKPEDMPEYVWYKFMEHSTPKCMKVDKQFTSSLGEKNDKGFCTSGEFYSYSKTTPATSAEYEQYINSNKQP